MDILPTYGSISALVLAAICGWAVLSSKVDDGVVIKVGLILCAIGYLVTFVHLVNGVDCHDVHGLARAGLLSRTGILIVLAGWCWRHTRVGDWVRGKFQERQQ